MKHVSAKMFGYSENETLEINGVVEEAHIVNPKEYPNGKDYEVKLLVKNDEGEIMEGLHGELVEAHLKALKKANPEKNYREAVSSPFSVINGVAGAQMLLRAHTRGMFKGEEVTVPVADEAIKPGVDIRDTFDGKEIEKGTKVMIKTLFRPYPIYPKGALEKTEINENGAMVKYVEVGVTITLLYLMILDEPAA